MPREHVGAGLGRSKSPGGDDPAVTSAFPIRSTDRRRAVHVPAFTSTTDILQFLVRSRTTIAVSMAVVLGLMSVYVLLTKPRYTARTLLLINMQQPTFFREHATDNRNTLDVAAQIESQIMVLRSDRIARNVVEGLNLLSDPEFTGSASAKGAQIGGAEDARTRSAVEVFQSDLDARRLGGSYVIEIAYTAASPERAVQLSNATANAYIEDQLSVRAAASRQGSQWLEQRLDELRAQMNETALKVQEFKARRDYRILGKPDGKSNEKEKPDATARAPITLEELESTADAYRKMYETYLQAHAEAVQRQSYPGTNARIISNGLVNKSHPKSPLLLLLAGTCGALLGLGVALVRESVSA